MITRKIHKFLQSKLGDCVRIESIKEVNLLSDPPIPQIWVSGYVQINGVLLEFKTTLSPNEIEATQTMAE